MSTRFTRWAIATALVAGTLGSATWLAAGPAGAQSAPEDATVFQPIEPCRLLDTRPGDDNVGNRSTPIRAGETHIVDVDARPGNCGDRLAGADALAMNVTIDRPTAVSYLTVFPGGADRPLASNLNWVGAQPPTPNKVDSKLSADGRLALFNFAGSVDVIVDVVGVYYSDPLEDLEAQIQRRPERPMVARGDVLELDSSERSVVGVTLPGASSADVSVTLTTFAPEEDTIVRCRFWSAGEVAGAIRPWVSPGGNVTGVGTITIVDRVEISPTQPDVELRCNRIGATTRVRDAVLMVSPVAGDDD